MVFIQSGYRVLERQAYLSRKTERRLGRSVRLNQEQRRLFLRILARWEEWLEGGDLCDVDGITLRAAEYFEEEKSLRTIRQRFPTDFILADEAQDFSTLELRLLRRLLTDPDSENAIYLVGDLNQKVFPKHWYAKAAGFNFQGRVDVIRRNYQNTRQILKAARLLPERYPPPPEEYVEVSCPELSAHEGSQPLAIECTQANHAEKVIGAAMQVLSRERGQRVAIVSGNDSLLARVRDRASRGGIECFELFTVEDIDLWKAQAADPLSARLVVSKLEAVKGFEFDTVILCDLSAAVVPRPGTPQEEYWREAAVVYSAMTRARDELVLTFAGEPSVFLEAIADEIDSLPATDEVTLINLLAKLE
jgi:superfamily I DNA/RNA helicase